MHECSLRLESYGFFDTLRVFNATIKVTCIKFTRNTPVRLNFLKIEEWAVLLDHVGFKITKTDYVGADERLAPEHHVLLIAERK